jgi:hypothetical protein
VQKEKKSALAVTAQGFSGDRKSKSDQSLAGRNLLVTLSVWVYKYLMIAGKTAPEGERQ